MRTPKEFDYDLWIDRNDGQCYRIPKAHLFTYLSIGCAELQEAANA